MNLRTLRVVSISPARLIAEILAVTAVYYVAARVGLLLAFTFKNVSPVWPPSGIALAFLLRWRLRVWPGITVGAFLANYTTGLNTHTSSILACGNTIEALFAAYLLSRTDLFHPSLARLKDVARLFVAAALSAIPAAVLGTMGLTIGHNVAFDSFISAAMTWWFGDAMGIVVVGSALLTWMSEPLEIERRKSSEIASKLAEAVVFALVLALTLRFVFGPGKEYSYVLFTVLVWAALRFGQRGATASVLLVSIVAVCATLNYLGPFVRDNQEIGLVYLQSFMAVISATVLMLAAVLAERDTAGRSLRESEDRFKLALEHTDITVFMQDRNLIYTWIYDGKHRFKPDKILGKTDLEMAPPEEAEKLTEIKGRVLKSGMGERHQVIAAVGQPPSIYDLVVEPIRSPDGRIVGVGGVASDITEIKNYQYEIELLNERLRRAMKETHHRVKNSLQGIAAMVDIRLMEGENQISADELTKLAGHIRGLATVHDMLTKEAREDGQAESLSSKSMIENLMPVLKPAALGRPLNLHVEDHMLPAKQATSLAIIICELVNNAVKHGSGPIDISFTASEGSGLLEITDEGRGFPEDFDIKTSSNVGLELVANLCRWDLGGELSCHNSKSGGACVSVKMALGHPQHAEAQFEAA